MQMADGIDARRIACVPQSAAVAAASGLSLDHAVRMTVYLTDLAHCARERDHGAIRARTVSARAAIGVSGLPRGALVEIDAILHAD